MSDVRYLSPPDVIAIHAAMMQGMGWNPAPLRSEPLLESAVMKAQTVAYYGDADLALQAATLAIGISQNQPFLDGNKRTAYVTMRTFLAINGWQIDAEPIDTARQLIAVAEREGSLETATEAFAAWLRERLVERPSG